MDDNLVWAKEQVEKYAELLPNYELYANYLRALLSVLVVPIAPQSIIQSRAKTLSSFAEKIQRKRSKYQNPVSQLTDLCGSRVIVQTREQVQQVCNLIEKVFLVDEANSVDKEAELRPEEFGYSSRHFIISLPYQCSLIDRCGIERPAGLEQFKAELQIRTFLQHAWAEVQHHLTYKGDFGLHVETQRVLHRLAAILEEADRDFDVLLRSIQQYESSYDQYLTPEEIHKEMDLLNLVYRVAPNVQLAARIGKLAMCAGQWEKAIEAFEPHVSGCSHELLRDLGVSLCKAKSVDKGRSYLEQAWELSGRTDTDAATALAKTWLKEAPEVSQQYYRWAYHSDPTDPYVLENYLNCELMATSDSALLDVALPVIRQSIARCEGQARTGLNMPWCYFSMGKFHAMLGDLQASVDAYVRGVLVASDSWMIDSAIDGLNRLAAYEPLRDDALLLSDILHLAVAARFGADSLPTPSILVYSSLVVEMKAVLGSNLTVEDVAHITWLDDLSKTPLRDSLRSQIDLMKGDRDPTQGRVITRVVGLDGSQQAGLGYRLALMCGAVVGLVEDAGGDCVSLLSDPFWTEHATLVPLVSDQLVLAAFAATGETGLSESELEKMAKAIHLRHREDLLSANRNPDPALWGWEQLANTEEGRNLQESSRANARDIARKLELIGRVLVPATDETSAQAEPLSEVEYEALAQLEHARWVAERLATGYRWAKEKDPQRKLSPFLVPWGQLDETAKSWDRSIVKDYPKLLADIGYVIVRAAD